MARGRGVVFKFLPHKSSGYHLFLKALEGPPDLGVGEKK
jgi:hypothetical protein